MSATAYQRQLVDFHNSRAKALLQGSGEWSEDDRIELETMVAIGIEAMKLCSPSRLREAARRVELRYHLRGE